MSSFGGRRENEGHESYLIDQQVALPIPYGHIDGHQFGTNGPYHLPQHPLSSYTPHFNSPYSQQSISPNIQHLAPHYSPEHSVSSTPSQVGIQHQPSQYITHPRYLHSPRYLPLRETLSEIEIEGQESHNENTMLSETIDPPLDGFPDAKDFDRLMKSYVEGLSVKKQDKALINAQRARNIRMVLIDPKNTAVETAQFRYRFTCKNHTPSPIFGNRQKLIGLFAEKRFIRFWVKKMFKPRTTGIGPSDCIKMVCHEGKPVAIREKLFKILTKAHQQCQHGGRDKTSAQVRRIYSWVPKELISRFVKLCPTCQIRRGVLRTPPNSQKGSPGLETACHSPKLPSPPTSGRESIFNGQVSQAEYLGQFDDHHGWVESPQNIHGRQGIISPGPMRSFGGGPLSNLSNSVSALDPFTGDVAVPSPHINYSPGYGSGHGIFKS